MGTRSMGAAVLGTADRRSKISVSQVPRAGNDRLSPPFAAPMFSRRSLGMLESASRRNIGAGPFFPTRLV